ncbi:hypothetical protein GY45DRAFT_158084 [Cubamyces sp. BRFM 1775]|nr:hypothetical protein GY45DRAFT_158084 [Cubamyces sp. BRFM 1775]
MSYVACPRCRLPSTQHYLPDEGVSYYDIGEICAIQEGTHVPVYEILKSGARSGPSTMFSPTVGVTSFASKVQRNDAYNPRPCVILDKAEKSSPDGRIIMICLMATFSRAGRLEDLPEVLQKFCIPFSPHDMCMNHPGIKHIHTTPEWQMRNTWIIAYRYGTFGKIRGRWQNRAPSSPTGSSYRLNGDMLALLNSICSQRKIQWEALSAQDPSLGKRCYEQYKVFRQNLWYKRQDQQENYIQKVTAHCDITSL